MKKLASLLAALALVLTLLPVTPASAFYGDGQTASDGGAAATGSFSIRRDPDSDSVDLSTVDYPALLCAVPTLIVDGITVPTSAYSVTYSWALHGLGVTPMNSSTSDEVNCCAIYSPYAAQNLRLECTVAATYNGVSYTAYASWNNIYRSSDYSGSGGSGSSAIAQPKTCKVSFNPGDGDFNGSKEYIQREYTAGDTLGALPEPTRENYIFVGWKDNYGDMVTPSTVVPDKANMWLRAEWKPVWETVFSAREFEVKGTALKRYTGTDARVVIPDGITSVQGFASNTSITGVVIPGSVKGIDFRAFAFCDNLSEVTLTDGLELIGPYAFQECRSLTCIVIPDGVTGINFLAFEKCTALTSATIPASVTEISSSAFSGCKNVTIYGQAGSYAETFAREQGIPFVAGNAPDPAAVQQPAPTTQPSAWAEAQANAAISAGIVPAALQSGYTRNATRAEFCALATALYDSATGMTVTGRTTFIDTTDESVEKWPAWAWSMA